MQVLLVTALKEVLQIEQAQGQEAGPGPGYKFVTHWILGGS